MKSMYLGDWKKSKKEELISDFEIEPSILEGAEILLAYYSYEDYEGIAFVLLKREGKLFEVNGSHCSCYGLEGQWDEEETTIEALKHRIENGGLGGDYFRDNENIFRDELKEVLKGLEHEQ